jgi:urease accessory protein UreF
VRLRGLDPFGVAALTAGCADLCAAVAADALAAARGAVAAGDLGDLPAHASPLVDVAAVEHRGWDVRLFAT